ncbi:MAG: DUF1844 domain-containing protein [Myxococcota bacterium]
MSDPEPETPKGAAPPPPISFGAFVLMLSTSARIHLGDAPAPGSDSPGEVDLEGARQTIDILEMLQAKTQGNLEPEEEALLASVLHALRLRFVEKRGA